MSYPVDMFMQARSDALKAGQLVLAKGGFHLAVEIGDAHMRDVGLLSLESSSIGQILSIEAIYPCCVMTNEYRIRAYSAGRPRPLKKDELIVGDLISSGGEPVVTGALDNKAALWTLNGTRALLAHDLEAEESVVYQHWELWITGEGGRRVGAEPLITIKV